MLINTKILKAVLLAAGKKDTRYYLNGVHVNARHIVATDGHRMHAYVHGQEWAHGAVTIPREAIEAALRVRTVDVEITPTQVGVVVYKPLDGRFPDYMRVIPAVSQPADVGTMVSSLNAQYLEDAQMFIAALGGRKGDWLTRIRDAWTWQTQTAAVVVMGERITEKVPTRTSMEQFK